MSPGLRPGIWKCWIQYELKLWMPRPEDSILQHLLKPEASPDVKQYQQCLFKGLVYWTKYPKIHVKSFKTVDAKASELHFATPSAWSWPWGWYHKIPIMSIQRASILNKIPKIHANSFKTVDVRASQDSILQHLLEPEGGPEGCIIKYQ